MVPWPQNSVWTSHYHTRSNRLRKSSSGCPGWCGGKMAAGDNEPLPLFFLLWSLNWANVWNGIGKASSFLFSSFWASKKSWPAYRASAVSHVAAARDLSDFAMYNSCPTTLLSLPHEGVQCCPVDFVSLRVYTCFRFSSSCVFLQAHLDWPFHQLSGGLPHLNGAELRTTVISGEV